MICKLLKSGFLVGVFVFLINTVTFAQSQDKILLPIFENDLWGFIDTSGKVVIKPQFKYLLDDFQDGLALVQLEVSHIPTTKSKVELPPTKYGFIDKNGKIVLEVFANSVRSFENGMAVIQRGSYFDGKYIYDGKYGFIDKTGRILVEPRFDKIYPFSEGLAAVKIGKRWGFIDRHGNLVIKPQFDDIENFSEGLAAIKDDGKWGYIYKSGKIVIKPQFKRARDFSEGMAQIVLNQYGDSGYIDKTGKIVIPTKYNEAGSFYNGKASVSLFKNNKFIHLCVNQKDENLPLDDCDRRPKEYPIFKFSKNTSQETFIKGHFVNESGENVFENKWDDFRGFSDGVALVYKVDRKKYQCGFGIPGWIMIFDLCANWGYIDKNGKYIWKEPELE